MNVSSEVKRFIKETPRAC